MEGIGVETQDLLDALERRVADRYGLPFTTAVSVVELYRHELSNKREPVSFATLIRLAQVGMIGPLTRRPPQEGDDER